MNHRLHLMERLERAVKRTTDPVLIRVLEDARRGFEIDEDIISDLYSRLNFLEDEVKRYPPGSPDDDKD